MPVPSIITSLRTDYGRSTAFRRTDSYGFTKFLNWLQTGSVFSRNVFVFLAYALAQTAHDRGQMFSIFV
jgi:hypothetical protein